MSDSVNNVTQINISEEQKPEHQRHQGNKNRNEILLPALGTKYRIFRLVARTQLNEFNLETKCINVK
jgi:hypothetical protein